MAAEYKNVRLTREAYELLRGPKREDESFSDAVERLAGCRSLLELRGPFSDAERDEIEDALASRYRQHRDRLESEWSGR